VTNPASLLIRADATVTAGTGHVMRCLALAQAWQDTGGRAIFASAQITDALRRRLADETCDVESISSPAGSLDDASETAVLAQTKNSGWVVVDGYAFGPQYQHAMKAAGQKTLFLDDYGRASPYCADVVLNQNVTAKSELYADRDPQTELLLGTRFCMLRREFARWRTWNCKISSECKQVLVLMGGSDHENITARVIEALAADEFRNLAATVVVGGSNPNSSLLGKLAASSQHIVLKRDVRDISELMATSDVAISASGSTCWELCSLGVPSLLIDVADNQQAIAEELNRNGCAIHIGDASITSSSIGLHLRELIRSSELRQSLSMRSRELVDGHGAERVVSALRENVTIRLRHAHANDAQLLWEWANDPDVRAASFSSAPIPWETHEKWFGEKSRDKQNLFLIAEDLEGHAIGQIRFDLDGGDAYLNFSLAKEKRGSGLATPLVKKAMRELWVDTRCARVHAFVKPQNPASAKTFLNAGFTCAGLEQVRGHDALHFFFVHH
jgi:UDP-2,4-diacetamido-2,4,6-trideoxy-beta-L-altropyranose hydrolase